jgi:hypothetical protein
MELIDDDEPLKLQEERWSLGARGDGNCVAVPGGDAFAEFSEQLLPWLVEALEKVLKALLGALRGCKPSAGDVWMYCFHIPPWVKSFHGASPTFTNGGCEVLPGHKAGQAGLQGE